MSRRVQEVRQFGQTLGWRELPILGEPDPAIARARFLRRFGLAVLVAIGLVVAIGL